MSNKSLYREKVIFNKNDSIKPLRVKPELEVIAFDLVSCLIAEKCGADRIELCANPLEGGTTPSYGMIARARKQTSIALFPIIRPRGGDFLYTDEEFNCMVEDILVCKSLGCNGVVIGMLNEDGTVDKNRCKELIAAAGNMEVTFHRAFDRTREPFTAMEEIIDLGCKRILTSGLKPTVTEGMDMLRDLVTRANGRIRIMPGSGVRSDNIIALAQGTGASSFHSSARTHVASKMNYTNSNMQESLNQVSLMEDEVMRLRSLIDQHFHPTNNTGNAV
jgi:copper homeostasis protein